MSERDILADQILKVSPGSFNDIAIRVWKYQYSNNPLYRKFCGLLETKPNDISSIEDIPFLPISLFKDHQIKTGDWEAACIFESSGTTGLTTSQHFIRDLDFYVNIALRAYQTFYGQITDYCFLALLPSYLERSNSSLVYMVDKFMDLSGHPSNGFYLDNLEELADVLNENRKNSVKTMLFGVTFALLDLAEAYVVDFPELIIMETGGMKGRRKELTRQEVHSILKKAFNVPQIHSEYGMTELLSQGYSKGDGIFYPAPSMKVFCRDITDPLSKSKPGKTGCLNIVDLGNIDSCSFIATDDLGSVQGDGAFTVTGRLDQADIRGCNLLVTG